MSPTYTAPISASTLFLLHYAQTPWSAPLAYGNDADLIAYLALTGRELPTGYTPAQAREMGSLWVDGFEDVFCGVALTTDASFPRDLYDPVPARVEQAAYEAGYAWATGAAIFGDGGSAGGQVIKERVDVIEVQYAAPSDGGWWAHNRYIVPMAYAHLLPFICEPVDGDSCRPRRMVVAAV